MKLFPIRLHKDQDLRQELQKFAAKEKINAGFIISCVGALKCLNIRLAGATTNKMIVKKLDEDFEIVSLTGTIIENDCHLHISVANSEGQVIGGHLKEGTIIGTTAEIVIGEDENVIHTRELDIDSGFEELVIRNR